MQKIKRSLGIYSKDERNLITNEETALRALLKQLDNASIVCEFYLEPLDNKQNLLAIITWESDTNRESLQLERRIEQILSKVGKK